MRVVAGKYGGRRLRSPRGSTTRPTADKVREALFSALGPIDGANVLDLFAGTGALGIEALSRGAARALFVESDRAALRALDDNLREVIDQDAGETFELQRRDARIVLQQLARKAQAGGPQFDLVFIDPPYARAQQYSEWLSQHLPACLATDAVVVIECETRNPLKLVFESQTNMPPAQERRYGDTLLRILHWAPLSAASE
ncbi:MAG: 16S rRNA (guanine(966)-N(2))-methyltransferase RsmD [Thermoleophilaceae bacterium]|nr:16S rRNA (guanine(966)-N(2))-methyltransferase RsmD [Thermoleophilaceae bacterium]